MSLELIRHLPANADGRDFVVGDVHGCIDLLHELLEAVTFDAERDRLFLVGDLIDRGPDSPAVLDLLAEPWVHAVRGNHEQMLIDVAANPTPQMWAWWAKNGGSWAWGRTPEELLDYAATLDALPFAICVGEGSTRFNVIHAEFAGSDADLDACDLDGHDLMQMIWGRALFETDPSALAAKRVHDGLSATYVGHNIVPFVTRIGAQFLIDTGSFLPDGMLTMVEPATGHLWTARHVLHDGTVNDEVALGS